MFPDARLDQGEARRIGGRPAVVVADMNMNQRCTGLEGLVRTFDLLGNRDRDGGILFFGWLAAGDRNRDDAGCSHRLLARETGRIPRRNSPIRAALRRLGPAAMLRPNSQQWEPT